MWKVDQQKMVVEIWSDIICPWCYIGKRRFEAALERFEHNGRLEIVWKSYQLDPGIVTKPGVSVNQRLAERKGWPLGYARQVNDHVSKLAMETGLVYNFDKAILANTFNAHRLAHLARQHKISGMEEALFKAYFTDGKNIDDHGELVKIGAGFGLAPDLISETLQGMAYAEEVRKDIYEAKINNVRGVPYFLFNRRYSISGAQASGVFFNVLSEAWDNWVIKTN